MIEVQSQVQVQIKLVDDSLPMPEFHSNLAAGFDLYSRQDLEVKSHQVVYVPLNVIIVPPPDYWVLLAARSSLHKSGLILANGIGVGDADFSGPEDEYRAILLNISDQDAKIERGQRLVQAVLVKRDSVALSQITVVRGDSRGGIGSTGK